MPQLYSENPLKAAQARDALCTLAQMREKLKDAHDIRVIEISAGSRVRGLVPRMSARQLRDVSRGYHDNRKAAKIHKNLTFFTSRRTEAESIRVLIRRLKRVVRHMKRALGVEDLDFALALEIEPGPLFVLNSIHSVRRVADRIRSEKDLNQVVGFNIDIAHCILAGIQPLDIFDRGIVEDRVCHFHISDHGIGHFGDAPLGDCGFGRWVLSRTDRLGVFTDWLDHANAFAQRVREKAQRRPRFSEVISVELEAVRFPHQIEDSVQTLSELLDAPNRPGRTGFLEVRGNALQDIERLVQGIEQRTVNFRRVRGLRQLVPSGVWWEPVRSAWHYLSGR
jgi:sugar phosphate isomerase/epimerase